MSPKQHQRVIDELQVIILQTIELLDRFEEIEMQAQLSEDYETLHSILAKATKQQRLHRQALLKNKDSN